MELKKKSIFLTLYFLFTNILSAQESKTDSTKQKAFDWMAYPYAMYTPESSFAFGVAGIAYFRTSRRKGTLPSQVAFSAYYTVNKQFSTFWAPIIYFNENKDEVSGELYIANKIDKFYGVGSNARDIPQPDYHFRISEISVNFKRKVYGIIKVIATYKYTYYNVFDKLSNPFLENGALTGVNGGNDSGLGFGINVDNRDNIFFPSAGTYMDFYSLFYTEWLGSYFAYNEYVLDARYYRALGNKNRVLALQLYSAVTTGDTPFYSMPRLGGPWMMRGYFEGRFRDKTYSTLQAEYRDEFFWKLGLTVFASMGNVGSTLSSYKLTEMKYSYGLGLRYMFDQKERINIRFDVAFGANTSGIYFGIKEAF
jgi:hypothetical protein